MATFTETPIKAYAHCHNPMCGGYQQREVDAIKQVMSWSYRDNGGDIPGEERSNESLRWADESEAPCTMCGRHRELATTERPVYQNLSGHDPMGIMSVPDFNPAVRNTEQDAEIAELKAQLNKLAAKVES